MNCKAPSKKNTVLMIVCKVILLFLLQEFIAILGGFSLHRLSYSVFGTDMTFKEGYWLMTMIICVAILIKVFLNGFAGILEYGLEDCKDKECCEDAGACQHAGECGLMPSEPSPDPKDLEDDILIHLSPEVKARLELMWRRTDDENAAVLVHRALDFYEALLSKTEDGNVEVFLRTKDGGEEKILIA